ncbi:MAG: hypothetical protein HW416_3792 [Chloroflexi bacterium]|nr:hypothetical protein [Chloroflexota bacterium]
MGSDFLFAQPSWLSGAARTLDVAGHFDEYNESPTGAIADAKALFSDWRIVGDSLVDEMKAFGRDTQALQEPAK